MSNKAKWDAVELEIAGIRKDFEAKLRAVEQERDAAVAELESLKARNADVLDAYIGPMTDKASAEGFALAKEQAAKLAERNWNRGKNGDTAIDIRALTPDESLCVVPRETVFAVTAALRDLIEHSRHAAFCNVADRKPCTCAAPDRESAGDVALELLERVAKP